MSTETSLLTGNAAEGGSTVSSTTKGGSKPKIDRPVSPQEPATSA